MRGVIYSRGAVAVRLNLKVGGRKSNEGLLLLAKLRLLRELLLEQLKLCKNRERLQLLLLLLQQLPNLHLLLLHLHLLHLSRPLVLGEAEYRHR